MATSLPEPFERLVDMGRAVGELGVSLTQAQWRIDQGTLDIATEMTQWARQILPEKVASDYAEQRTVFYSMPRVQVHMESIVRVHRTQGGLLQVVLGLGKSKTSTQETRSYVDVTLVAVPVTEAIGALVLARNRELQMILVQYLRAHGFFGPRHEEAVRRYNLRAYPIHDVPATGNWGETEWQDNLLGFKVVWNQDAREASEETFVQLPLTRLPDRLTLSVLDEWAGGVLIEESQEAMQSQARILLAALISDDDVRRRPEYPRDRWEGRWGGTHQRALVELGISAGNQPTLESLAALRRAWDEGRRFQFDA